MTTPASKMGSLEDFSAAEQIFNDPDSWRRESGKDWVSERCSDDDSMPGAERSDSLRGGRRKPKPPSFSLKPFTNSNFMPVNEPTPSNVSTPSSIYPSPLPSNSAPESPFDLEKVYGLDLEDIYGRDLDSPLLQSISPWTGVSDTEELERSQILARLIQSSKSITTEMSELAKQRMSIFLGQGNILRAFPTPQGFEFDFEGGDFITPVTGITTGSFAHSSPSSLHSSRSDQVITKNPTRLSLKKGLRISTTTRTTTMISIESPRSNSSHSSTTIISAASTPYSILDFYGTSPGKLPKTAGLLTSSSRSSSQIIVPKTSHPTMTTFSSTPIVPLPPTGSRSAVSATFSLTQVTTINSFLPNGPAKIIELPEVIVPAAPTKWPPPALSIVTSVPSRLEYKKNTIVKEITPLMVTKKRVNHSKSSGQASPRPLPRVPRALTPPPPVPALPTSVTVPSVSELPITNKASSLKVTPQSTTSSPSRIPTRKRSAHALHPRSPPANLPLPPLPQQEKAKQALSGGDSKADGVVKERTVDPQLSTLEGEEKDGTELYSDPRGSRLQNRTKMAKLRSATPPPRGSRPLKNKPVSPVPPTLPSDTTKTELTSKLSSISAVPLSSSTGEVIVSDVIPSTLLPPSAALSPPVVSPVSSSGSTYPSPSLFPSPPTAVPRIDPSNSKHEDEALPTDVEVASLATKVAGDRVDPGARSLSAAVGKGKMDGDGDEDRGGTTGHVDPPVIRLSVSVELGKDSCSITVPDVTYLSSTGDEVPPESSQGQVRDVLKSRSPSLIVLTTSVIDLVENAYANGIPPVDENSPEVILLRADSPKLPESGGTNTEDVQSPTEPSSTRPWRTVRHVGSASRSTSERNTESLDRTSLNSTSGNEASRTRYQGSQVKQGSSLRHSRSAVQLGLGNVTAKPRGLFERDIPLPDCSLLAKRTRGASVDGRPLVADAFVPAGNDMQTTSQASRSRLPGEHKNDLISSSTLGVNLTSAENPSNPMTVSTSKPGRPPRSQARIPSVLLSAWVSVPTNEFETGVGSSSRPVSPRSSEKSSQSNPLPALAEKKESVHGAVAEESTGVGIAPADGVMMHMPAKTSTSTSLLVVVPPTSRSLTPVPFGKLPPEPTSTSYGRHRRSVSENQKLSESTISSLAKRERRPAPTPMPSERTTMRTSEADEAVPNVPSGVSSTSPMHVLVDIGSSSLKRQMSRAPTPPPPQRRPMHSADTPVPSVPHKTLVLSEGPTQRTATLIPTLSNQMPLPPSEPADTISGPPRSTLTYSPKPSVEAVRGRAPTPTSDRKRLPSDVLPPVPNTTQRPSLIPQSVAIQMEKVKRAVPIGSLLTRSRSASTASKAPPVPSGGASILKVSTWSTPMRSPSNSVSTNIYDRVRRAPTPSGSRPVLQSSDNIPDVSASSVSAGRYRKPSISAESRSVHASSSSSSATSGFESSARRFPQPKQTTLVPTPILDSRSAGKVHAQPPPLPPKAESRGRIRARPESPIGGGRARSVPRKVREGGSFGFVEKPPIPSFEDERMRRGRGRPDSPEGRKSGTTSDTDGRETRRSLYARSRSVGPALAPAEQVIKARKRTSSLSVVPPPVPNSTLTVPPGRPPLRVPSPLQDIVRGRTSPFPMSSSSSRPLSRALTSF